MIPPHANKVFSGVLSDVYQWEQELFDGSTAVFETIRHQDTTEVLAVKDGKMMIQDQEQPNDRMFLCLPGGRIESDKDPIEGAKRELLEETGFTSEKWQLYHHHESTGHIQRNYYVYLAQDCVYTQPQQLDAGERIHIRWVTLDELLDLVDQGRLTRIEHHLHIDLIKAKYHTRHKEELEKRFFSLL